MRTSTVFNRLLNLQGGYVRDVQFADGRSLVVTVQRRARKHRCPHCSYATTSYYDHTHTSWRHVSLGAWRVTVRAFLVRITCPTHGVTTESVPWAEHDSRFTRDFEDLVAWVAREMNATAVTRLLHIAWRTVGSIVERVVQRKLDPERLHRLYRIGVDEVSYRKGHKYLTVVADHVTGEPVWIEDGRTQETLGKFFDELGLEWAGGLQAVTMDMCAPYIAAVRQRAPQAEIAFDPFHVVKLANEAVQQVRREEARSIKGTPEAQALKGSRWTLLKAPENLREHEQAKLAEVAALNTRVYRAYLLKEELRTLYMCGTSAAEKHLDAWAAWASRSRLQPFVRLARTLRQYREGVLAAIRMGLSNGRLEGINNKISVLKHRAYGFHSPAALIAMIFLCCCKLDIKLPI